MTAFYHVINVILDVIIVYAFVSNFNYFVLMALGACPSNVRRV